MRIPKKNKLTTNNNQPVVLEDHMRLSFRQNIRTLSLCTARDHVDLPTVTIFQLDVVPELVELDQKILRASVHALRSSKDVRSQIIFKDRTVYSCNQFLKELDDSRNFE
jgi:hypothetical protein